MASIIPDLARDNLSLYTIPAAWLVAVFPRLYGATLYQAKTKKSMDPRAPRDFAATVGSSAALDTATKRRIQRAEAAQANGFENMGLFAAAVVAGNFAKLDASVLNGLALGYIGSRVLYNYLYINNDTGSVALMRTATFFTGLGMVMALFVQAGNKLRSSIL